MVGGTDARGGTKRQDGVVPVLFFEVPGVADTDEHVGVFVGPCGGDADGVVEYLGEFHVVETEIAEVVIEGADLPGDILNEDVSGFDVELGEGEVSEGTVEEIRGVCGSALDFGVQAGPDFVGSGRSLDELEPHFEGGPLSLIEEPAGDVPQTELGFSALKIGSCGDAEVPAG